MIFVVGLVSTMFMVWFERKVIAGMQNRIGPNKAGPFGILQTLADGIKLFFKEDLLPDQADGFVFRLAPYLAFVPAFLVWTVIPLGGDFRDGSDGIVIWFGEPTRVQLADPPIGILLVLARVARSPSTAIMLAGWSSGSKYPLLGLGAGDGPDDQLRGRARPEPRRRDADRGHAVDRGHRRRTGHALATGTSSPPAVVPFIIFMIAATAELNRPPFDLVEAEQELVGGFNTEYSSIRFALFFLAEFMNTITMSAVIVTLFLGGPQPIAFGDTTLDIPLIPNGLEGTVWFLLKMFLFLYVYVWLRGDAAAPALRPADGPRLEDPDPDRARLVPAARRDPGRRATTTGTPGSSSPSPSPRSSCRTCSCCGPSASAQRNRERRRSAVSDGLLRGVRRSRCGSTGCSAASG